MSREEISIRLIADLEEKMRLEKRMEGLLLNISAIQKVMEGLLYQFMNDSLSINEDMEDNLNEMRKMIDELSEEYDRLALDMEILMF